jgi:glycerol dehydrogenase-like iron-containing ADH family enzyme
MVDTAIWFQSEMTVGSATDAVGCAVAVGAGAISDAARIAATTP